MTVQGPVKEQQPDGMSHRGVRVMYYTFFPVFPVCPKIVQTTQHITRHVLCHTSCMRPMQRMAGDVFKQP